MKKNGIIHLLKLKNKLVSVIFLVVMFTILPLTAQAFLSELNNGADWLKANHNPAGSWGEPGLTELRDTTVVADIFKKLSETGTEYTDAIDFITISTASDNDFLARKVAVLAQIEGDISQEINALLAAKNQSESDSSFPNYPEGGWGPFENYSTTCLDTALALGAISYAPVPKGLLVVNKSIIAGETQTFYFDYPSDTSNFSIFISDLIGNIDFRIFPDESSSYNFWGGLTSSTYLGTGSLTIIPGTRQIQIYANSNSTYSFQITLTSGGYDSSALVDPVAYLISAQNLDGGWGLSKGSDSSLSMTARVLIALGGYADNFDLGTVIDSGVLWLKTQQNPDGGFGTDTGSTYETALSYIAMAVKGLSAPEAQSALAWIAIDQKPNGSWNDTAYDTAISMLALYISMMETDSDTDGIPDLLDNCPDNENADQLDTDGDTLGDACDDDDDNDGLTDEYEINSTGTNPLLEDSDNDGILDGLEDMDFDGVNNEDEALQGTDPRTPDIKLTTGLNLFGYPTVVPMGYTSYDLLYDLGTETEVLKIQKFNTTTGIYETTEYLMGAASGNEFDIESGQGYLVYMKENKLLSFTGILNSVPILLEQDFNLISLPSMPSGLTSYDLLSLIGDEAVISSIQRFNTKTGAFETTAYENGTEAGILFNITNSEAYMVHMKEGITIPALLTTPVITITSPLDGAVLTGSPTNVSGTVSDSLAAVSINGISAVVESGNFTATGIPLVAGPNSVTAQAMSTDNLIGSHTITLTLDEGIDYEINKGDSVSDARRFQGDSALLDQTAFYTEEIKGVPAGVTYTNNGVSRVSATEFEISFIIQVSPAATEGIYEFEVEYGLLDSGSNPLIPLSNNVFEFKIKILP